jgi:hypothetical protein
VVDEPWVVWSFEHNAWWAPDWCGYTPDLAQAGRYSEADARDIEERANRCLRGGRLHELAMPLLSVQSFVEIMGEPGGTAW